MKSALFRFTAPNKVLPVTTLSSHLGEAPGGLCPPQSSECLSLALKGLLSHVIGLMFMGPTTESHISWG